MADKPLLWLGSALDDLREFPARVQRLAGFQLRLVQQGLPPNDWKPMTAVGTGVREIRIRTRQEHRVIYLAHFPEAVYFLHAFEKHSQKASRLDIELARKRLSELIISRRTTEDS